MWDAWWVWAIAASVLGILELLAPGHILLGFALGAGATSVLLLAGGPVAALLSGSAAVLLLFFALASLGAWLAPRRLLPGAGGSVRRWDRDINED